MGVVGLFRFEFQYGLRNMGKKWDHFLFDRVGIVVLVRQLVTEACS